MSKIYRLQESFTLEVTDTRLIRLPLDFFKEQIKRISQLLQCKEPIIQKEFYVERKDNFVDLYVSGILIHSGLMLPDDFDDANPLESLIDNIDLSIFLSPHIITYDAYEKDVNSNPLRIYNFIDWALFYQDFRRSIRTKKLQSRAKNQIMFSDIAYNVLGQPKSICLQGRTDHYVIMNADN